MYSLGFRSSFSLRGVVVPFVEGPLSVLSRSYLRALTFSRSTLRGSDTEYL